MTDSQRQRQLESIDLLFITFVCVCANKQQHNRTVHRSANLPLPVDSKIGVCHGHRQRMKICLTLQHLRNSLLSALLSMPSSDEHAFLIYLCSY